MLATYLTSPHFPQDLKRLALKAALEIGFMCESSPFWLHLADILKIRESEQMSEKQRAFEEKDAEEEKKKRELEVHAMRLQISAFNEKLGLQTAAIQV